jgi:hypothetical protein
MKVLNPNAYKHVFENSFNSINNPLDLFVYIYNENKHNCVYPVLMHKLKKELGIKLNI